MSYMVEGLQGTPVSLGGSGIPASPRGLSGRLEAWPVVVEAKRVSGVRHPTFWETHAANQSR